MKKIIFLLLFIYSCNTNRGLEPVKNLDQEVYSQIFSEIVDTLRYKVIWEDGYENMSWDEVKSRIYKDELDLVVDTNLTAPDSNYFNYYKLDWLKETQSDSLIKLVKNFRKFESDTIELNLQKLNNIKGYKFNRYSAAKKHSKLLGDLTLSRISFNTSHNYACFYLTFYNSPKNALGQLVIIEKSNEKWFIKDRIYLWES